MVFNRMNRKNYKTGQSKKQRQAKIGRPTKTGSKTATKQQQNSNKTVFKGGVEWLCGEK